MSLLPSPLVALSGVYDGAVESVTYTMDVEFTRAEELRLLQSLADSIDLSRLMPREYEEWRWGDKIMPSPEKDKANTSIADGNGGVVYALTKPHKRWTAKMPVDGMPKGCKGAQYRNEVLSILVTDDKVIMPIGHVGAKVVGWTSTQDSNEWEDEHGFTHTSGYVTFYHAVWQYMGVVVTLRRNEAVNAALDALDARIAELDEERG